MNRRSACCLLCFAWALACVLATRVPGSALAADDTPAQPAGETADKSDKSHRDATPQPNDKKLTALQLEFVKKFEKLATEFEHNKQPDKAAFVYEQILRLVPENERAQMQLDRLRQREATSGRKTFEVLANQDWQDTGVRVIAGKPLKLSAKGEWTFNMSHKLGPDGMEMPKVLKDFKLGSLIGIIADPEDKAPKPFFIGASKEFVAEHSGPLLVRMHDSDPSDNRGSLMLEIVGRFDTK